MESEYKGPRWLLGWHEICSMGVSVAWWRARYELKKRFGFLSKPDRLDIEKPQEVLAEFTVPFATEGELLAYYRGGSQGRFYLDRAAREDYAKVVTDCEATVSAAQKILQHDLILMGQRFSFAGEDIDWHHDPLSGNSWEPLPWTKVDIRSNSRLGDIKFTWELNRHQFWPTLGRAYWLTGDERFPSEWGKQFKSWCEQNPPEIGVNWVSNLEHALRLVSWWTTAKFMMHSPQITGQTLVKLIGMMVAKARHIVCDLDYSIVSMANNHLIGDAMGLAFLGMAIPELKEAEKWRQDGLDIMWAEAEKQIYADGCSFECSASYHRFTMQFYMLILVLADLNNQSVPDTVRKRIETMAEFVMIAMRPDGSLPQFGDWDNGLAYRLNDAPLNDFRPLLSTAAVMFNRADFKQAAGRLDQETIWLLGPKASEEFDKLENLTISCGPRAFTDGGYFFHRGGPDEPHLFVANGRFTSHTHADQLSIALFDAGKPLLVDAGSYTYNGSWRWRTYFRNSLSHNTLTVDGHGQALAHRAFRWLFPPKTTTTHFAVEGPFLFDGKHDGYRKWGIEHRRIILELGKRDWLCLDLVQGRGTHLLDVRWQLAPGLTSVHCENKKVIAGNPDGADIRIEAIADCKEELVATVLKGQDDGPGGWYSPAYGQKEPANQIVFSARAPLPVCVATIISTDPDGSLAPISLKVDAGETVQVNIGSPEENITVTYNLSTETNVSVGSVVELGDIERSGRQVHILRAKRLHSG